MDVHGVEHVLHQRAPLPFGRFLPQLGEPDRRQQLGDLLEPLRQLGAFGVALVPLDLGPLQLGHLRCQPLLLLAERLGADPVVVVQLQELGPLRLQAGDRLRPIRAAGGLVVAAQLGPDGVLKIPVLAQHVEPEHGCP
ncbi:MAG: hypothetical protein JST64_10650 [Actinobacteria bacterium]|nr:hypothetical protein [Actinomycetota bacterium]